MRSSRAPEGRGTPKPVIFLVLIAVLLFAGLAATYFTQGFGSLAAAFEADSHCFSLPSRLCWTSPSILVASVKKVSILSIAEPSPMLETMTVKLMVSEIRPG